MRIPCLALVVLIFTMLSCDKDKKDDQNQDKTFPLEFVPGNVSLQKIVDLDISGDGRFIVITTLESLTQNDNDQFSDVYRYDRNNGSMTLISTNLMSNAFGTSITNNGNSILYSASQLASQPTASTAIYLFENNQILTVQEGQQDPFFPYPFMTPRVAFTNIISPNGEFIGANVDLNHFVYDRNTQQSQVISNGQPYDFSTDGRFHTWINVDVLTPSKSPAVWLFDRQTNSNIPITTDTKYSGEPSISGDGRFVVFESEHSNLIGAEDNNGLVDIFLFDRTIPKYTRITSANSNGESTFPDISADGQVIVFASHANSLGATDNNLLSDIYVRVGGQLTNITPNGNGNSTYPRLSADGRFVVFYTEATNLGGSGNIVIAGPLR